MHENQYRVPNGIISHRRISRRTREERPSIGIGFRRPSFAHRIFSIQKSRLPRFPFFGLSTSFVSAARVHGLIVRTEMSYRYVQTMHARMYTHPGFGPNNWLDRTKPATCKPVSRSRGLGVGEWITLPHACIHAYPRNPAMDPLSIGMAHSVIPTSPTATG